MYKKIVPSFVIKISLLLSLLITAAIYTKSFGQTILSAGDMAIIGIKTNNNTQSGNDAIKLVTFVDLTCGTQFVVTDNNWRTSNNTWYCNDDEFAFEMTVTSKICAGSIIYIDASSSGGSISSSSGALTKTSLGNPWGTDYGLSSGGDNVFILGADNPTGSQRTSPTFIFGLKHNGPFNTLDCSTGANPKDNSGKPSTLSLGTNAVEMSSSKDQWHYNCSNLTSGTKAALLTSIADPTKWRNNTTESWNTSSCTFTVTDPCTAPTHKSNSFSSSSITQTTATISWLNCTVNPGNTKVLVVARAGAAVATDPTSGSTYTANASFGAGSTIGAGFAVFDGIGTSVNLTNLTAGTSYFFSIYEYSCTGNCYNIDDLPGSITTSAALPVNLLSFSATLQENNIILFEWLTTSENNNNYFDLEYSEDAITFHSIARLNGKGVSQNYQYYNYSWVNTTGQSLYFRLKQVDQNGAFQYSTIEKTGPVISSYFEIFPNPASDELFIKTGQSQQVKITLFDLFGKEIHSDYKSNVELQSIDLKFLPTGGYMILFLSDNQTYWKKFHKL